MAKEKYTSQLSDQLKANPTVKLTDPAQYVILAYLEYGGHTVVGLYPDPQDNFKILVAPAQAEMDTIIQVYRSLETPTMGKGLVKVELTHLTQDQFDQIVRCQYNQDQLFNSYKDGGENLWDVVTPVELIEE